MFLHKSLSKNYVDLPSNLTLCFIWKLLEISLQLLQLISFRINDKSPGLLRLKDSKEEEYAAWGKISNL